MKKKNKILNFRLIKFEIEGLTRKKVVPTYKFYHIQQLKRKFLFFNKWEYVFDEENSIGIPKCFGSKKECMIYLDDLNFENNTYNKTCTTFLHPTIYKF